MAPDRCLLENIAKFLVFLQLVDAVHRRFNGKIIRPKDADLSGKGHTLFTTRFGRLDVLAVIEKGKGSEDLFHNTIEIEFSLGAARFVSTLDISGDVPLSTHRSEELSINELTDYAQGNSGYRNPSKPGLVPFKGP